MEVYIDKNMPTGGSSDYFPLSADCLGRDVRNATMAFIRQKVASVAIKRLVGTDNCHILETMSVL